MSREADQEDFQRLFPEAMPLEGSLAFRTFRYARRDFDRASPTSAEENCRKAMKCAFYTAAYFWLLPASFLGMPGAILLSFRSNAVVDALAAVFLIPTVAAFALYINRFQKGNSIYTGKVRTTWGGMLAPRFPEDE